MQSTLDAAMAALHAEMQPDPALPGSVEYRQSICETFLYKTMLAFQVHGKPSLNQHIHT